MFENELIIRCFCHDYQTFPNVPTEIESSFSTSNLHAYTHTPRDLMHIKHIISSHVITSHTIILLSFSLIVV